MYELLNSAAARLLRASLPAAAAVAAAIATLWPLAAQTPDSAAARPLTLAEAVARASREAPGVTQAALRVEAGEAKVREARSALLPNIGATATYLDESMNRHAFGMELPVPPGTPDRIGPFDIYDARVRIRQPVFDFAAWKRMRLAGTQVAAAAEETSSVREDAAARAGQAYLAAARAQSLAASRRADAALASELRRLAERQLDAGAATGIDLTRAKSQEVLATSQLRVAVVAEAQARIALARAVALDPGAAIVLRDTLAAESVVSNAPDAPDAATSLALQRRPELRLERTRAESSRAASAAIRAERLPRLDVGADYGRNGPDPASTIGTGQVAVQVSLPILDGLGREARLAEQAARLEESKSREADLRFRIEAEVRNAILAIEAGEAQLDAARERVGLAEQELAQARQRFANGLANNIELINAQSNLNRAREAEIDARFATAVARLELARATGVATSVH